MAPSPRVSGVVAAYNYERYLGRALESALRQDYPADRLELVVVDDGSTDATPEIAQRYAAQSDGRIRYIRQDNGGLAAATTRGMEEARGELITFLDADDTWPEDRTRLLAEAFTRRPEVGLVYGDMEIVDEEDRTVHPSFFAQNRVTPARGRVLPRLLRENFISAPALMVRASLRDRFCPIPSFSPYQDWFVAARVAEVAEVDFLTAALSRYRVHGGNMNHGKSGNEVIGILQRELPFRRWILANLRAADLAVDDLVAAFDHFVGLYMHVARTEGVPLEHVIDVSNEDKAEAAGQIGAGRTALADARFAEAAGCFLAALAADPWDVGARHGLDHSRRGLAVPLARRVELPGRDDVGSYCIKPGYVHRDAPEYFVDLIEERDNVVWQPDVYPEAARVAERLGARRIIDLGPGSGDKLAALHPRFEIVGIDFGPNLDLCRQKFPYGSWREHDFDSEDPLPLSPEELTGSVVVCADVIEHLVRPDLLLDNMRGILESVEAIILSTPERDRTRGADDLGPPEHLCHVREWNISEFAALMEAWGFEHGSVGLTRSNDLHTLEHTILAIVYPDADRDRRASADLAASAA
ncbi:MAG: glycosyltransferase [Thermoleophilaceae bacterium]